MAVTSNILVPDRYTGDGSTTQFSYTFLILDSGDMAVYLDGVLQSSGFSVSGVGNALGGIVTFTVAPASGVVIVLTRETDADQQTDLTADDVFPALSIERQFDHNVLNIQELHTLLTRAVLFGIETTHRDVTLPTLTGNSGKFLSTDGAGLSWATFTTVASLSNVSGSNSVSVGLKQITVTSIPGFSTSIDQVFFTPNWNTVCWLDESSLTNTQFTVFFASPAPTGGGTVRWLALGS